jgi:hypothetical protein
MADTTRTCFHTQMTVVARSRGPIFEHVVGVLRHVAAPCEEPITEATELYSDLGLAGEDLGEAIDEIRELFQTDFSQMDLRRYAPNETGHNFGLNLVRAFQEWRGQRTYRCLTVGSLIDAVHAGAWGGR